MSAPDPVDPASSPEQAHMNPRRRFWRWGIWFWLLAWIISIPVLQLLVVNLTDYRGLRFCFGAGSIGVTINTYGTVVSYHVRLAETLFLWSDPHRAHFYQYPGDMFGLLGHVGWEGYGSDKTVSFPIAGLLWLWLIGAWTNGFKTIRWPESFKSRRVITRIVILISLPLLILSADYKWRVGGKSTRCVLTVRNIQQAVRSCEGMNSLNTGAPMPWDKIFGPGKFLSSDYKKCACGQPYRLISHVPGYGELAAQCPNPEHQRRMKAIDTSDW